MAREGAVQVHEVQPFRTRILEGAGLCRRVGAEDGRGLHFAAQQADAVAVLQVDGGVKDHGGLLVSRIAQPFATRAGGTEGRAAT